MNSQRLHGQIADGATLLSLSYAEGLADIRRDVKQSTGKIFKSIRFLSMSFRRESTGSPGVDKASYLI